MRILSVRGAVFLLIFFFLPTVAGCSTPIDRDAVAPFLVEVRVFDGTSVRTGKGTVTADGYVVTAAHILPDTYVPGDLCSVATGKGEKYDLPVLRIDRDNDCAYLHTGIRGGVSFLSELPPEGVVFYDDKTTILPVSVVVSDRGKTYLELPAIFPKGTSGAPVFSLSGAVIGMIVSCDGKKEKTYALPAATIQKVAVGLCDDDKNSLLPSAKKSE